MNWPKLASDTAYWIIPPGIQELIKATARGRSHTSGNDDDERHADTQSILARNRKFLNKHKGERCFVLATGPSIREQNLKPLSNEWCIAVSEFYKHEDYNLIRPAYYAFARNHPPFTDDDKLRELTEMKKRSHDETFFFAIQDKAVVERSNLVADSDRVHYLHFKSVDYRPPQIDLTRSLPAPCSAAVIAVWIAIHMGFAEIYMLGCDHDLLWKWDGQIPFIIDRHYEHFYDGAPTIGNNPGNVDGVLKNFTDVRAMYRWSDQLAKQRDIRIINANPRSRLDFLPRIAFGDLF